MAPARYHPWGAVWLVVLSAAAAALPSPSPDAGGAGNTTASPLVLGRGPPVTCEAWEARRAELVSFQKRQKPGSGGPYIPHPSNNSVDSDYRQEHVPYITLIGNNKFANVSIGAGTVNATGRIHVNNDVMDPLKLHYVPTIYVVNQDDNVIAMAEYAPSDVGPYFMFEIPAGTTRMIAYEYCNLHGLYEGYWVDVPHVERELPQECAMNECYPTVVGWRGGICFEHARLFAEAKRRQYELFLTLDPFLGHEVSNTSLLSEIPSISLQGSFGRVSVGNDTFRHDMVASRDDTAVHYIHSLYVADQYGTVIAATFLTALDTTPTLEFEVPEGTTRLTPYSLCVREGLFEGASVETPVTGPPSFPCGLAACGGMPLRSRRCRNYESLRADLIRDSWYFQQKRGHPGMPEPEVQMGFTFNGIFATLRVEVTGLLQTSPNPYDTVAVYNMFIINQDDTVVAMETVAPTDIRSYLIFEIPAGTRRLRAVVALTLSGLHYGEWHDVRTTGKTAGDCSFGGWYGDTLGYDPASKTCPVLDMFRVQMNRVQNTSVVEEGLAWDVRDALSFRGNHAVVVVPERNSQKVRITSDPHGLQYVKAIYVEDQESNVVAAALFAPTHEPRLEFALDTSWETLTPHIVVNTLGPLRGDTLRPPFEAACLVSGCPETPVVLSDPACPFPYILEDLWRRSNYTLKSPHPVDNSLDAPEVQRHVPFITQDGKHATVTLGAGSVNASAPFFANHAGNASRLDYVSSIFVVDQHNLPVAAAEYIPLPGSPTLHFEIPMGTTRMKPVVYCNPYGLLEGYWTDVTGSTSSYRLCKVHPCFSDDSSPVASGQCRSLEALFGEAHRMQALEFGNATGHGDAAWPPDTLHTHEPRVHYDKQGGFAEVTVGVGQTQEVTPPPADHHYVDALYIEDDRGRVVGMKKFWGASFAEARYTLEVPPLALSLTPYLYCSSHGLFRGRTVEVQPQLCGIKLPEAGAPFVDVPIQPPDLVPDGNDSNLSCTPSGMKYNDREHYSCEIATEIPGLTLHWRWGYRSDIHFAVEAIGSQGWLGIAFPESPGMMYPAKSVICSGAGTLAYSITSYDGVDHDLLFMQELSRISCTHVSGTTLLKFSRSVGASGEWDVNIALNREEEAIGMHSDLAALAVDFETGHVMDFRKQRYPRLRLLHGWLMMVAWCWLIPLSVMSKRYGKHVFGLSTSITVGDMGPAFKLHAVLAGLATVLTMFAFAIAFKYFGDGRSSIPDPLAHSHVGPVILMFSLALALLGMAAPACVPHAGPWRTAFAAVHSWTGRCLAVLSLLQCLTGVRRLQALREEGHVYILFFGQLGVTALLSAMVVLEVIRSWFIVAKVEVAEVVKPKTDIFKWEEVRQHNTEVDPWLVVEGKIYAVRAWLRTHPGGHAVLLQCAGEDATSQFNSFRHSRSARGKMDMFFIGEVANTHMVSAITLAEAITRSLSTMDLSEARAVIQKAHDTVPKSLLAAYVTLLENLRSYTPFLPDSLREGMVRPEAYLSREQLQDRQRRQNDPIMRRVELHPPTACAVAMSDIQCCGMLWSQCPAVMGTCIKVHNEIVRGAVSACRGYEARNVGDAFLVAFEVRCDCVMFALNLQVTLIRARWPQQLLDQPSCAEGHDTSGALIWAGPRVRIGLHWGEVSTEKNPVTGRVDFLGPTVAIATAVHATATGGSIAVTRTLLDSLSGRDVSSMMQFRRYDLGPLPSTQKLERVTYNAGLPHVTLLAPALLEARASEWFKRGTGTGTGPDCAFSFGTYIHPAAGRQRGVRASFAPGGERSLDGSSALLPAEAPHPKFRFRTTQGTVVLVRPSFSFLASQPNAPDALQRCVAPLFDLVQKCEGIIKSACGEAFVLSWNVTKRCTEHPTLAARCMVLYHRLGWNHLRRHTAWGNHMHWGIASGRVLHGKAGTDTQRIYVMLGGTVFTAYRLATLCTQLGTYAACTTLPHAVGIREEPGLAPHLRPLEAWSIQQPERGGLQAMVWEINMGSLGESSTTWGFSREPAVAFEGDPGVMQDAAVALAGGGSAEDVITRLNALQAGSRCVSCSTRCAVLWCEHCGAQTCLRCAEKACATHDTRMSRHWGDGGHHHLVASLRSDSGPAPFDPGFMLADDPPSAWLIPSDAPD